MLLVASVTGLNGTLSNPLAWISIVSGERLSKAAQVSF